MNIARYFLTATCAAIEDIVAGATDLTLISALRTTLISLRNVIELLSAASDPNCTFPAVDLTAKIDGGLGAADQRFVQALINILATGDRLKDGVKASKPPKVK